MSDYVVAVGFETDAGTVKRSTDQFADSVGKVGTAQTTAARSAKDLASAQSQLERLQAKMTIQQQRLAEATDKVQRMQARGATNSKFYTAALEKQLQAQDALARSVINAERIQAKGNGPAPTKPSMGSRVLAGAAGFITADVLTKFTLDSIKQADDLRGTLEQNQRIFGASAGEVLAIGKNSAEALGLSKQAAIAAADSYGQLFQTLKVGKGEAAEMSTGLVKVGVDLAAFEKVDPQQVFDALKGGLSGQFDGLQRYGVYLNTATVRQEAMRLGLVHGKEALTQNAQAAATYSLILKQASDRQGTFANGADEVARKQAIVQAKLADAKAQFGQSLVPTYLALADAGQHLIPVLTGVGKALGFIVEHDTTRKIAEVLAAMYAINKVVQLGRSGVDRLTAAYARLAVTAGEAAAAERTAAGAAVTTGGKAGGVGAVGLGGPAGLAVTTGLTLAATAQGPEQSLVDDGKVRGGKLGQAEKIAGEILQGSNALTTVSRAWSLFKAKAKETDANVSDTVPIVHLTGAMARAQERVDTLAATQLRLGRSLRYAIIAQHDARALAASAAQQPIGGLLDALPTDDVDLTGLHESVRSAQQAVSLARSRLSGGAGASSAQILSAEASVASARAAARRPGGDFDAEQARLRAAEARLTELRQGGNRTAQQSATAEKGLADARERLRKANKALTDGEEKVNGLSLKSVLDRADAAKGTSEAEVRNVRKLVKAGLTSDVIEDLKKLEATAPGTLANVAKALTPAYVKQLNHDAAARRKAAQDLAGLGGQAVHNDAVKRAQQLADDQAKAYKDRLLLDLKDPDFRAQLETSLGQLLTPGLPGGPTPTPPLSKDPLNTLYPPTPPAPAPPPSTVGTPKTNAIPRDDLASYRTALPTQPASSSTVTLSPESVAAVGNTVRSGATRTSQHTNVFPNVSNFGAAIDSAERKERNSRIMGG